MSLNFYVRILSALEVMLKKHDLSKWRVGSITPMLHTSNYRKNVLRGLYGDFFHPWGVMGRCENNYEESIYHT